MFILKCKLLIDKAFAILTASPTPVPEKRYKYINSATSDVNVGEKDYGLVGKIFEEAIAWLGDKLLDFLDPFANWGCRIIIISCFVIYYCSHEQKYIALAIKWGIIFALFWVVRSAVQ